MRDAFAISAPGIEPLVAAELKALGASGIKAIAGGVEFKADDPMLARVNINLRTASRVVVRLARFKATAFHELERAARQVVWADVLRGGGRFALRVTCKKSRLYHSDAVAERVSEAIARAVPGALLAGAATEEDEVPGGAQLFIVRFDHDQCTISADTSGELLHRRGYRQAVAKAPLRETLAAAMLIGAGYDPAFPLADPLCGAGTIPIEAALIARGFAPGLNRRFAAERWPRGEPKAWNDERSAAAARVIPRAPAPIIGADRDEGAIEAARANAERAGVAGDIEFRVAALSALEVPAGGRGLLIANPPYGIRVGESKPLRDLFARFGQVAATICAGWDVALLSADKGLEKQTKLLFAERWSSSNGGIPVRLVAAPAGAKATAKKPRTRSRTRG